MANLFLDSFDHYATADVLQKWSNASGFSIVTGRTNNGAKWTTLEKSLTAGDATFILGFAFQPQTVAFSNSFVQLGDGGIGAGNIQVTLVALADGSLKLYRGTEGTGTLLGTSAVGLITTTVQYVELKVTVGNSGSFEVRVNGATAISATGVDTQNQAAAQWTIFGIGLSAFGGSTYVDDLYVNDGTGSINNNFWGDTRIDVVYPDGDGASSGWTPSTGTAHYSLIDESAPNGDTDYNSTATINAIDEVTIGNTPMPDNTIRSVQALASAKKTDAGAATMALMARQDAVDYVGTTASPGTSYAYVRQVYERAPDTSIWSATIFNAMQFGYKRLS